MLIDKCTQKEWLRSRLTPDSSTEQNKHRLRSRVTSPSSTSSVSKSDDLTGYPNIVRTKEKCQRLFTKVLAPVLKNSGTPSCLQLTVGKDRKGKDQEVGYSCTVCGNIQGNIQG